MTERARCIVIGAGHNGLVCAAYLARAGREVVVLEAADEVGGAAITREFAPGFRVSACAHLLNLLDAGIARELELERHGLTLAASSLKTIALDQGGNHLVLDGAALAGPGLSDAERAAFAEYDRRMSKFAEVLRRQHDREPPRLGANGLAEAAKAARLGLDIRRLGRTDMREFLRIAGINIYDVLEEQFEHRLLKGALALDAVLGNHLGPRSNNSVLAALHRRSGRVGGRRGAFALPRGGMGSVTAALAAAAREHGVAIRTGSRVEQILVEGTAAIGVRLAGGEELRADVVVSGADPKTTLLRLLGARHLEAGFADRISQFRSRGVTAKLHLALAGAPVIPGLTEAQLAERLLIAPDPVYIERAFDHAKYGEFSEHPVLEIVIPSLRDPSLAPPGQHVLSAVAQYAPFELRGGWESGRAAFQERLLATLETVAPGLRQQIVGVELLTPPDIQREFRISGGHWHHGELALDQFLMLRPVPGAARYAMPIAGLYLCSAGTHPGGGVMGNAGRNAARAVLGGGT